MLIRYISRKYRKLLLAGLIVILLIATVTLLKKNNATDGEHRAHPELNAQLKLHRSFDKTADLKKDIKQLNETLRQKLNMQKASDSLKPDMLDKEHTQPIELGLHWDETEPNYNVHTFYYPWYGNPEHDGKYYHWNHQFIPHWNKKEAERWPKGQHIPPRDIGANFYPVLGPYSSSDVRVIDAHMKMMRYAQTGVLVVSWYPPGDADNEGKQPDELMPILLDRAHEHKLKVALHIEPYNGRDDVSLRKQLEYIQHKYGHHPAFYRTDFGNRKKLPLIYIYDSYLVDSEKWANIFSTRGINTVRGTDLDGIFIGLVVEKKHKDELQKAGFDGLYTYFATNGFTYGSTWNNWEDISRYCTTHNMMFIPSVGPGYVDTAIRPWNQVNTRKRLDGKYYRESISSAKRVSPNIVSITSFNEWHEGTQIESAASRSDLDSRYTNYGSQGEHYYLTLTKQLLSQKI